MSQHLLIAKHKEKRATVTIDSLDESEKGLACRCLCWHCGGRLVARLGKIKRRHFAHYRTMDEDPRCGETALHLLGKWLITQMAQLPLVHIPANSLKHVSSYGAVLRCPEEMLFGREAPFLISDVAAETTLKSGIRPDLLLSGQVAGQLLTIAVEIRVTHAVDDEKLERLSRENLTTVEIDLSGIYRSGLYTINDVAAALKAPVNQRFVFCAANLLERTAGKALVSRWQAMDKLLAQTVFAMKDAVTKGALGLPALPSPPEWVRSIYDEVVELPAPPPMPSPAPGAQVLSVQHVRGNFLEVEVQSCPSPVPLILKVPNEEFSESPGRFFDDRAAFLELDATDESLPLGLSWGNHPAHTSWLKKASARVDQAVRAAEAAVEARSAEHVARMEALLAAWFGQHPIKLPEATPSSFGLNDPLTLVAISATGAVMPEIPRVHSVVNFERTGANSFILVVAGGATLTLLVTNEVLLDGFLDRPTGGSWVRIDYVDLVQAKTAHEIIEALQWGASEKIDRWMDRIFGEAAELEFSDVATGPTVLPHRRIVLADLYRMGVRNADWNVMYLPALDYHRVFASEFGDWQLAVVHALLHYQTPHIKDYPAWMSFLHSRHQIKPSPRRERLNDKANPYRVLKAYFDYLLRQYISGKLYGKAWAETLQKRIAARPPRPLGKGPRQL